MVKADRSLTQFLRWPAGLALVLGVGYLGFAVDRMNFWSLFGAFSVAFLGYWGIIRKSIKGKDLQVLIGLGLGLRLLMVVAFPLLSDDIYRFIWDGLLINAGENPFAHLPAHYLEVGNEVAGLTPELFAKLNSPDYYTIYPPIAQGVFAFATWLSPGSWYGAGLVMKLFLLACEIGSLAIMYRLLRDHFGQDKALGIAATPVGSLLLYWLNPLIIVEICGNLHFEGAMVFFLLLAFWLLIKNKWARAGMAMAASVASKLLPLLLLPYLIRRLWGKPFWIFSVALGTTILLFFAPLLAAEFLDGFGSSLDLYFRKFEFNASLYYLAREIGYSAVGWNLIAKIGPAMGLAAALSILLLAALDGRTSWRSLAEGWMWAFLIYLSLATTIHPWYLSVPLALACFTRWRFPFVWSFLIMLTYTNYITDPYQENLWLVSVEYALVIGFALWEWRGKPIQSKLT